MIDIKIPIPADVKGIIFDLDGTLIDSMPLHYDAYNHCLLPWGITYPKELFLSRAGMPALDTLKLIEKENNISNFDARIALNRKREFVDSNIGQIALIEPMFELVKAYHRILPMSIGTGSNRAMVDEIYKMFSLSQYIPHSVTATEVDHFKPHPETFLKCAEIMGVNPEECVVYEDGIPGIEAAKTAGMHIVDVTKYL